MTIYEQLKAAGVPLDHHESDLYARVEPKSRAIVAANYPSAKMFRSQIDGELWYDIPFAYDPWWIERGQKGVYE